MTLADKSNLIKSECKKLGFSDCGIVPAQELKEEKKFLQWWLEQGFHGEMKYLERNLDKRTNPALLVPGAKSVVVALLNYYPKQKPRLEHYKISKYALFTDYHYVIKQKLRKLHQIIEQKIQPTSGRAFTDSAPLLEQALAVRAGLGWIGKNSLLLTKKGSYFFIGELVIDLELAYDIPFTKNFCGNCTSCIDACPTGAIIKPHTVDARRCISYLTIEKRGEFEQPVNLHGWIFGCDICQDACPWNKKAIASTTPEFEPKPEILSLTDKNLENLTKPEFKKIFKHTPVERTGYKGLIRNIKAQKFYPLYTEKSQNTRDSTANRNEKST